jgi:hypothetical protein
MQSTPIVKIEAVTISQKIVDQIENHNWDQEMENMMIGWCSDRNGIRAIGKSLEGRYFKCYVSGYSIPSRHPVHLTDLKNRFPQIFVK